MSLLNSGEGNGLAHGGDKPGYNSWSLRPEKFRRVTPATVPDSLLDNAKIQDTLRRLVSRFAPDPNLHEDMMQECMVCLWRTESKRPGQTVSWYLQHCRFHVQHCLVLGRSVDSPKRAHGGQRVSIDVGSEQPALEGFHTNGELFEGVCVRDLVRTLARHLGPKEQMILGGLAAGMALREAASQSKVSYPTALKYRRKIATVSRKLGIEAPRSKNRRTK